VFDSLVCPDVVEHIFLFLDTRTLINMCLVSKTITWLQHQDFGLNRLDIEPGLLVGGGTGVQKHYE